MCLTFLHLQNLTVDTASRVGAGNGVTSIVIAQDGLLTTSAAMAVLRSSTKTKTSDSTTKSSARQTSRGDGVGGRDVVEMVRGQGLVSEAALVFTGSHDMM